jgi:signal transduction histidine kinase
LAICTQITAAHGGTIRVARTGPGGTTILVTLPVEGPANG